LKIFAVERK